jgi:hypothetical protein
MSLINSIEHFPELSESITRKSAPSTPLLGPLVAMALPPLLEPLTSSSQSIKVELVDSDIELENQVKVKTQICKSLITGSECPFKNKCSYIHYTDELENIGDCGYGSRCVRFGKGKHNPCLFYHPGENRTKFLVRLGLKEAELLRPAKIKPKYTKMCNSVYENIPCEAGRECTFAHNKEQLKPLACNFGKKCFLVSVQDGIFMNTNEQKICQYIHADGGESIDNYEDRILKPNFEKYKKSKEIVENPVEEEVKEEEVKEEEVKEKVKEDKITLIVPSHMALEIMEILLKNGKRNVEIKTY